MTKAQKWSVGTVALAVSCVGCRSAPYAGLKVGMSVADVGRESPGSYVVTRSTESFSDARLVGKEMVERLTGSIATVDEGGARVRWWVERGDVVRVDGSSATVKGALAKPGSPVRKVLRGLPSAVVPRFIPRGAEEFHVDLPRDQAKVALLTGSLEGGMLTTMRSFRWTLQVRGGRVVSIAQSQSFD